MKQLISIYIGILALALSGCNTLMEAASPSDTTQGYRKETNSSGETVYKRERYVAPRYTPEPTPVPPPTYVEPQPVFNDSQPTYIQQPSTYEPDPQQASRPARAKVASPAIETAPTERTWAFGGELSSDSKRTHLGLDVFKKFDWLEARGGVSLFKGDSDLYAGFDAGLRPTIEIFDGLSLFGGVGIYGGDTKRCSYNGGVESCEKKFLYAGFVEGGAYIFNTISIFARSYNIEEAGKKIPSDTFVGVGLRTSY